MSIEEVDQFLEHHGVKGQKWGIRNKSKARPESKDHASTKHLRRKPVHSLSNEEIKKVNERLNLEQNYSRLNPSRISAGKKTVAGIIGSATLAVSAYNLATSPAGKSAIALGRKAIGK